MVSPTQKNSRTLFTNSVKNGMENVAGTVDSDSTDSNSESAHTALK